MVYNVAARPGIGVAVVRRSQRGPAPLRPLKHLKTGPKSSGRRPGSDALRDAHGRLIGARSLSRRMNPSSESEHGSRSLNVSTDP